MNIFISCSGDLSELVAGYLRIWLRRAFHLIKPLTSFTEITPGSKWHSELSRMLEDSNFGIICLTGENLNAPWINYEAGALSNKVGLSKVIPYLVGIKHSDVPTESPLHQFQMVAADKNGTYKLVHCINECINGELKSNSLCIGDLKFSEEDLKSNFKNWWWPDLEIHLGRILN